jgi:hypothetical protein
MPGGKLSAGRRVGGALGFATEEAGNAERDAVELMRAKKSRQAGLKNDGDSATGSITGHKHYCSRIIGVVEGCRSLSDGGRTVRVCQERRGFESADDGDA